MNVKRSECLCSAPPYPFTFTTPCANWQCEASVPATHNPPPTPHHPQAHHVCGICIQLTPETRARRRRGKVADKDTVTQEEKSAALLQRHVINVQHSRAALINTIKCRVWIIEIAREDDGESHKRITHRRGYSSLLMFLHVYKKASKYQQINDGDVCLNQLTTHWGSA